MTGAITTEAIVLRSMKYRETSKIVTFYTKEAGKLAGIVKGARRPDNRFGSALEPMSHVTLVVYRKEGREIQTVAQCDHLRRYPRLTEDLAAMAAGMSIIELTGMVAHEEEKNHPLFALLAGTLAALNRAERRPSNFRWYFEVKLLEIAGVSPVLDRCAVCRNGVRVSGAALFHIAKGGVLCESCAAQPAAVAEPPGRFSTGERRPPAGTPPAVRLEHGLLDILAQLAAATSPEAAGEIEPGALRGPVAALLTAYLRYHLSGIRPLKSEKIFSRILTAENTGSPV